MGAQVIHHDDVPRLQTWGEKLFHLDFKGSRIGRSFQDHGSSHALERERGDQGRIRGPRLRGMLPVARSPFGARAEIGVSAMLEPHSSTKTN
jgi:hypothetical protein